MRRVLNQSTSRTAVSLCESMLEKFHDSEGGGFFLTEANTKNLIVRAKEAYDGATPSGNSMAALLAVAWLSSPREKISRRSQRHL